MNFYKITTKNGIRHGLQYDGELVKHTLPVNSPSVGIYYAREDILAFLDFGDWIHKVVIPEDSLVFANTNTKRPTCWKADKVELNEGREITLEVIKGLIEEGANPTAHDSKALLWASEKGYVDIVRFLIPLCDPKADKSKSLRVASDNGHTEIVKLLIPVSDTQAYSSAALYWAARMGHVEVVKLLIPVSDPKADNSKSLRIASMKGYTEVVKLLIPVSDPKAFNSFALRWAIKNEHADVVELLKVYR